MKVVVAMLVTAVVVFAVMAFFGDKFESSEKKAFVTLDASCKAEGYKGAKIIYDDQKTHRFCVNQDDSLVDVKTEIPKLKTPSTPATGSGSSDIQHDQWNARCKAKGAFGSTVMEINGKTTAQCRFGDNKMVPYDSL